MTAELVTESAFDGGRRSRPPASRNPSAIRAAVYQLLLILGVVAVAIYLLHNVLANRERLGIAAGFGFLGREAGFEIGEGLIAFTPADSYARALLVGLLNTLYVAALGILLATIIGTLLGIARLSANWLMRSFAAIWVDTVRNIPVLLQLFVWWNLLRVSAPGPREAWQPFPSVFISNRGLILPVPVANPAYSWILGAFLVGIAAALAMHRWARRRQMATGRRFPTGWAAAALLLGPPLAVFLAAGMPFALERPVLHGFNFSGGKVVTPEFVALLTGLVVYTAGFIAEIVRAGILAVSAGQSEAAMALGLRRPQSLRLVILPQALRLIVPPLTSQYLNLTKNSSLAVAIGFPDVTSIANTTINQTGQAIEGIAIIMAVYESVSLLISLLMNWYGRATALVER
ncbi:MAG: amino acid ABC transporter permease [Alphaproteobacteria bacterium]|nr:amino acid ABC transporter permease [Alphaproteobacteria bacterium]